MSIKVVGGHGTTTTLGSSGGQEAKARPPQFLHTQGPAAYQAPSGGGGFKMTGGQKKNSRQAPNKSVSPIVKR